MLTAVFYGIAASSALIIGALIGARLTPARQVTGVLLAFASGALISALAFELFEDAFELGGPLRSGLGLLAGTAAFVIADSLLDRHIAGHPGPDQREVAGWPGSGGPCWPASHSTASRRTWPSGCRWSKGRP